MPDDEMSMLDLIERHVQMAPILGIRLVAVDGPSGSGKSKMARQLADRLQAPLIQIDDFVSWVDFSGWWPRFETQVLEPLISGRDAMYQQRDWEGHEFGNELGPWRTIVWSPVVIIEGVTSTRKVVASRLACRIWIEAPADVRLNRGLARDGESHRRLWERWMVEEEAFFAADQPWARADFIVSGVDSGYREGHG